MLHWNSYYKITLKQNATNNRKKSRDTNSLRLRASKRVNCMQAKLAHPGPIPILVDISFLAHALDEWRDVQL